MPPVRRLPIQSEAVRQSEFLSLSERMSRDLSSFGHEQRRESDALSLENIGIQLPEDGGITGTTGYESLLEPPTADESTGMAPEAPDDYEAPTTQPRRRLTQPTVGMPQIDMQESGPVYNPAQVTEIQGEPDYDPTEDAGAAVSFPATTTTAPAGAGTGASAAPAAESAPASAAPAPVIAGKNPVAQARIYQQGRASGLDDEGARVLVSVSETEGGMEGAIGDNGQSRGIYQFHERGELPAFRAWVRKNGIEGDPNALAVDPEIATRYAAEGYLGQAIKRGRELGYTGAELATYVQRTGQRSVHPETTGENYTRLFGNVAPGASAPVSSATVAPTQRASEARAQSGETRISRVSYPLQQDLTVPEKWAVCGPLAIMGFAAANGTPIDYETAKAKAAAAGWTAGSGMAGPASTVAALKSVGVPSSMEAVNWERVKADARNGNPVILSSPGASGHYFVVQGVDDQGRLDLGNSALTLAAAGHRRWFTPEELRALGPIGAVDTAIYMDNPASPAPSHAVSVTKMPPAHENMPKIIRERDALALTVDTGSAAAPGGSSSPPVAGSSPLDAARASTGGGQGLSMKVEEEPPSTTYPPDDIERPPKPSYPPPGGGDWVWNPDNVWMPGDRVEPGMQVVYPPDSAPGMPYAPPLERAPIETGETRIFRQPLSQQPGTTEPIVNPDGSVTTERSITVTDPGLNGGRPTNIPTVWSGRVVSDDEAVQDAINSGMTFPSFTSIDEAVRAAEQRSQDLGAGRATSVGGATVPPEVQNALPNRNRPVRGEPIDERQGSQPAAMMLRGPLDPAVPVRDRWADEPAPMPYDPDQGPREAPPGSVGASNLGPSQATAEEEGRYQSGQRPTVSVEGATAGPTPTPAGYIRVEAPRTTVQVPTTPRPPEPEPPQVVQQGMGAPNLKPVWDAAGAVVGYVQGAFSGDPNASIAAPDDVTPRPGSPYEPPPVQPQYQPPRPPVQSTPGEADYVPPAPSIFGEGGLLEPMAGLPRVLERTRQIEDNAARELGWDVSTPRGQLLSRRAPSDPGWRARNPETAAEYDALQNQLGLTVAGQAGDSPQAGRAARALPEPRRVSGEVVSQTGASRGEVIPPATDPPAQAWGLHHQIEALQRLVDETPATAPERPALVGRLNEAKNDLAEILEDVESRLDDAKEAVREADRGWFENPRLRAGRSYDELVGEPQAELDFVQQERAEYPPRPRFGPISPETQAAINAGETGADAAALPAARVVTPRPPTSVEPGSTTAFGMFGPQPSPGRGPQRRTVEVIQEELSTANRAAQAARRFGDDVAARQAREEAVRLESELADALNARRAAEPVIRSEVGRRIEEVPADVRSAEDAMRAQFPDERVRTSPSDLSGPVSVPVADPRSRLNTITGPSAPTGAGRLAQINADLGNTVFGGVTGATAGAAAPADTAEERRRNALIGAGAGMAGFPIAGRMLPRGPAGARMALGPQGSRERPTTAPGRTFAFGARPGERVEFNVKVVPLSSLITSHTDNLAINPKFPSELQPRVRERAASRVQIDGIINRFDPDQMLIDTHTVDRGPMIVGPDNVVESGNGRSIALRRLAREKPEEYARYVEALRDELPRYGLAEDALESIDQPVLVRERVSDVDRTKFAAEANVGVQHDMSPIEEAMQDAGRLSDTSISRLVVGENQTIDEALLSGENGDFRRAFMASLPESVRSGLLDADGNLNAKGLARAKAALLVKTYPGSAGNRLATAFVESTDPGVSNVRHAINASLPTMARVEAKVAAGEIDPALSLAQDVAVAADVYSRLRRAGTTIGDYLAQATMFSARETSPLQDRILGYLSDNARSPRKMRALLEDYARTIEGETGGVDMFGDAIPTRSKDEVLDDVLRRLGSDADPGADLGRAGAGGPVVAEPGVGSVPIPESGPGVAPSGGARSQASIDLPPAPPSSARPPVAPPRPGPMPDIVPRGGPEGALRPGLVEDRSVRAGAVPPDIVPRGGPEGTLAQEGAPVPLARPTEAERGALPAGGPEGTLRQEPGAPPEVVRTFRELIRDPEKADAAAVAYQGLVDAGASPEALATFRKNAQDSRWWDRFDTLRYASMLSDPVTHGQNAIGNVLLGGVDVLERPLTALLDKGRARITGGPREVFMSEAGAQVIGMAGAARQGIKDAAVIMEHGLRPEDLAKLDTRNRGFGTNIPGVAPRGSRAANIGDFAAEGPLRALSAADALFRGTFRGGHLAAEAERAARVANDGKPVTPAQVAKALLNPDVAKRAEARAAQAVLQEDRTITTAINAARNRLPAGAQAAVSVAVPYIKTPYNIVAQGLGMTPAGVIPLIQDIRAGKPMAERERRVSRMLIGGGVMAWASLENMAGLNTGGYPEKESERSTLPPGWRPYSRKVQVGGQTYYVPLAMLGPVGIPAMISVLATEQYKKGNGFTGEMAAKFAEGVGQLAEDQTFLRSISDATEALSKGGNTAMNYVERQASQFSPHVIGGGGIGRRVQAIMGQPTRDPDGVVQAWLATLPYGDQAAKALGVDPAQVRRDVIGRPQVSNPSGAAALVPIRASVEHDAAIIRAYRQAGEGLPRAAPKSIRDPDTERSIVLTPRQRSRWQIVFGQELQSEWSAQGSPRDADDLRKVERTARERAADAVLGR